ncbi:hypothetical protein [Streptomyces sp. NBC_00055]|uniref:hypothetical protein n=1 Tax=Streptomyces sp. NBC_00055 TaxID=2975632 RepID=UPI003255F913
MRFGGRRAHLARLAGFALGRLLAPFGLDRLADAGISRLQNSHVGPPAEITYGTSRRIASLTWR